MNGREGPAAVKLIVGVPRSGTSVLHALACTDPLANPYIGEASYLRLLIRAYRHALELFDTHTRYAFPTEDEFLVFHRRIIAMAIDAYWQATGCHEYLVLKDPMLTSHLLDTTKLVANLEVKLILRNPVDTLASRVEVQQRKGNKRNLGILIEEHNHLLESVEECWQVVKPNLITYPMLFEKDLGKVRKLLSLGGLDRENLWKRAFKHYPKDGDPVWMTELFNRAPTPSGKGKSNLSSEERTEIVKRCLPVCLRLLSLAQIRPGNYWQKY